MTLPNLPAFCAKLRAREQLLSRAAPRDPSKKNLLKKIDGAQVRWRQDSQTDFNQPCCKVMTCRLDNFFRHFRSACLKRGLIRADGHCLFDAFALHRFACDRGELEDIWSANTWAAEDEWLIQRAERSLTERLMISSYMEQVGEEYTFEGLICH